VDNLGSRDAVTAYLQHSTLFIGEPLASDLLRVHRTALTNDELSRAAEADDDETD